MTTRSQYIWMGHARFAGWLEYISRPVSQATDMLEMQAD